MKTKSINYISYPLIIISITLCISGIRWLLSSEPWMLDQVANEERLQMTFESLFAMDGNYNIKCIPNSDLSIFGTVCIRNWVFITFFYT